ncbi:recombinase family protein [Desulfovibrio aerotolerans]|uniref:Recombinase family protein n=1 Tax=Solidesulfovibrio aerotolerans TaxID=295255 RepID=A0A7C9MU85_9BACT|nr:recombinase family protein [Solidesulfovibrio aerotolerans]MYL82454.1 recombinase family protein [Solidesulfovibrio aerotolerans]
MTGQHVGYIRTSATDQNLARQLDGINLDRLFEEQASAKDTKRPVLQECLAYVRTGDFLHVHSVDRLCRNLSDLLNIVTELVNKGVCIKFHKENLSFGCGESDSISKLMLSILGAVAGFERDMIKERQREGIAIAKRQGKHLGRKSILDENQITQLMARISGGEDKSALAREYGVSRATLYNVIGRKEKKQ